MARTARGRAALRRATVAAAALAALACAPRVQQISMDPLEFATTRTADGGVAVDLLDPEALFREGVASWEEKRWDDAVRKFGLILRHFPDSRFVRPALYNRGLALLSAPRPAEAGRDFDEFVRRWPDDPDVPDALLKAGQAWQENGDWAAAEGALVRRLAYPMTLVQELEARARLARALRLQGRYEESREQVNRVLGLADRNATRPELQGNYFVAMASYEGAEAWHDLFSRIRFTLPTDRMEKDLTDKATLFLKAQSEYLRTLRMRNVYWGVQAGTRVGRMYEEFYDDIMNAETPPEFTEEELSIYMGELRRKARPLVSKAVAAYERNLSLAKMYGARDEWLGDMASRLSRLRQILAEADHAPEE